MTLQDKAAETMHHEASHERAEPRTERHPAAVPAAGLLGAGLALGLLGDLLLRAPDAPGLGMSLWVLAIGGAAWVLHVRGGLVLTRERQVLVLAAALLAAGLAWRDAPQLKLLSLAGTALAFGFAAYRMGGGWVRRAGVLDYASAFAAGALYAWTAAVFVLVDTGRSTARTDEPGRPGWRRAAGIARGLVIAVPFLLLFGALFMSADAAFERLVLDVVHVDFENFASHVALFAACGWLTTGYLRGLSTGTKLPLDLLPKRPTLGITEVATVLTALDLLFLVFVVLQFRYLFGGDALVQGTPDLTVAEYARRGFFELVAAGALVVPLLLVADGLLARGRVRDDRIFRLLAGVQIALILAIAASALQRLRLYHASYGLTDARLYAAVLLVWIIAVLIWFAVTVLRGRRHAFAFGALTAGVAMLAGLYVANPDAIVARTNVARAETLAAAGADPATRFDGAYATSLSADAAPILLQALPSLPANAQCRIATRLLARWGPQREADLRGWSWSVARARDAVRAEAPRLRTMAADNERACR